MNEGFFPSKFTHVLEKTPPPSVCNYSHSILNPFEHWDSKQPQIWICPSHLSCFYRVKCPTHFHFQCTAVYWLPYHFTLLTTLERIGERTDPVTLEEEGRVHQYPPNNLLRLMFGAQIKASRVSGIREDKNYTNDGK